MQPKTRKLQQLCCNQGAYISGLVATDLLQQADIRIRSHGLQQLVDNKSGQIVQVGYQYMLSTGLLKVVSTTCN